MNVLMVYKIEYCNISLHKIIEILSFETNE